MAFKIPSILIDQIKNLVDKILPPISEMAVKAGIEGLGTLKEKLPDVCLPQSELEKFLELRNRLMDQINNISNIINSLSKLTNTLQPAVTTVDTSLTIAKTTVNTITTAMLALPPTIPVPPQLLTGLINAVTLVNGTLPPILTTNVNKLNSLTTAVDFCNTFLLKIKDILSSIDNYLKKCGVDPNSLTPLNNDLQQLQNNLNNASNLANSNTYKGFIIDIVEEPYSPTVNRRRAVARNKNGIIELQTPLTFSTDTKTLIEEIKLVIDSNNLKAD